MRSILVNGRPISFKQDSANKRFWQFDKLLPPDSVTAIITITVVSTRGGESPYRFYTKPTRVIAQTNDVATKKAEVEIPREVAAEPQRPMPVIMSPWRQNQKRNIGYGVAAAAGLVIGASGSRGVGFGIVGTAAVVAGIDAVLTSRRAASPPQQSKP